MNQLSCCVKKDLTEIIRKKRIAVFNGVMILISAMVLITTLSVPSLVAVLADKAPEMITDGSEINQMMGKLFPQTLAENLGIWSSDVGVFFTFIITIICSRILKDEITNGRWILVLEAGYKEKTLVLSKIVSYGAYIGAVTFLFYNIYFNLARVVLIDNYNVNYALINSIVFAFVMFSITNITFALSIIYKNPIMAVLTIVATIMVAPDVLTMFSFGKYLPTYVLTYIYTSSENIVALIIPLIELVLVQVAIDIVAIQKIKNFRLSR